MLRKIIVTICLIFGLGLTLAFADTDGVWHEAEDVRGGTFGSDEGFPAYTFASIVNFTSNVYMTANLEAFSISIGGVDVNNIFVNEGQANSITSAMIQDGVVSAADLGTNSVGNDELIDNPTVSSLTVDTIIAGPSGSVVIQLG